MDLYTQVVIRVYKFGQQREPASKPIKDSMAHQFTFIYLDDLLQAFTLQETIGYQRDIVFHMADLPAFAGFLGSIRFSVVFPEFFTPPYQGFVYWVEPQGV